MQNNFVEVETKWLSDEVDRENEGERIIKSTVYLDLSNLLYHLLKPEKLAFCCYLAGGARVHENEIKNFSK